MFGEDIRRVSSYNGFAVKFATRNPEGKVYFELICISGVNH